MTYKGVEPVIAVSHNLLRDTDPPQRDCKESQDDQWECQCIFFAEQG